MRYGFYYVPAYPFIVCAMLGADPEIYSSLVEVRETVQLGFNEHRTGVICQRNITPFLTNESGKRYRVNVSDSFSGKSQHHFVLFYAAKFYSIISHITLCELALKFAALPVLKMRFIAAHLGVDAIGLVFYPP